MSEASAIAPERARFALPHGELVIEPDRVSASLVIDASARQRTRAVLDRIRRRAGGELCLPAMIDDAGGRLALDYAVDAASQPLAGALRQWRGAPAVHLPEVIALAQYVARCAEALGELVATVAIAPVCLRLAPASAAGAQRAVCLLAVPLVDATLAAWSRASYDAWAWRSSAALIGGPAPHAGAYAVGAALYTALAGDLFPVRSSTERFRRALRGQVGARDVLGDAVRAALPPSFAEEAVALEALVAGLLAPEPPPAWRDQLAELGEQLHAYRTAVRWEHEGRIDVARQILECHAAIAPRQAVPWEVLARLRERDGDEAGALEAALEAVSDGDRDGVRLLVARMQRVASELAPADGEPAPARAWLDRAIAAVDRIDGKLGDRERICVAHVEARHLGHGDRAAQRLAAAAAGAWDEAVRRAICARLCAANAEWLHVARLCKDARRALQAMPAMPATGGGLGAYLVAYLDYLDGVAHFGAVGLYGEAGYLADAFERFVAALDGARATCAPGDPLIGAAIDWLGWIAALAAQLRLPAARAIASGVDAYLAAHGIAPPGAGQGVPPLIWYDEDRLLARSEAS